MPATRSRINLDPNTALYFSCRTVDACALVRMRGPTIHDHDVPNILSPLASVARAHRGRCALDMSHVPNFSCAWLNALVALSHHCRQLEGQLAVAGLTGSTTRLLNKSGMANHFHIAPTQADALSCVRPTPLGTLRGALSRLARRGASSDAA